MDWGSVFPVRLKEARLKAGLSQEQLGIKAGFSDSASSRVNQYERLKHLPHLQDAIRLADALKVPLPSLFCQDAEVAADIVKFLALGKEQRKQLLGMIDQL
jgi:transcriptional regulator with XRE-family HTH domain